MRRATNHISNIVSNNKINSRLFSNLNIFDNRQSKTQLLANFKYETQNLKNLKQKNSSVFRYETADVKGLNEDKPQIIIICQDTVELHYGNFGENTNSEKPNPVNLCNPDNKIIIKPGYNVINVDVWTPLRVVGRNYIIKKALRENEYGEFRKVLSAEQSLKAIEANKITELSNKSAELLSANLQSTIFAHPKQGNFGPESTGPIVEPSPYSNQSLTLMRFFNTDDNSPCHFHFGKRMLLILTTNKTATATFYTSGIAEEIDSLSPTRKVNFEENSVYSLTFPNGFHHRFDGFLVAASFHAYDSPNVIKALTDLTAVQSDNGKNLLSINTIDSKFEKKYLSEIQNNEFKNRS